MNTQESIKQALEKISVLPNLDEKVSQTFSLDAWQEEGDCQEVAADELRQMALSLEKELREGFPKAEKLEVCINQRLTSIGVVNSNGVDLSGTTGRYDITVSTSHKDHPLRVYEDTISVKQKEEIQSRSFLERLKNWECTFQPEGSFTPGTYRAVLSSRTVNYLLVTGWQIFSGVQYQNGRSALNGKIGEKLFPDCVNIWDYKGGANSRVPSGYSFLIDMEGTPCQDVPLVENGVFKGLLHNLSSGDQAGVVSTGNAGRKAFLAGSIHTDMTVIPGNFTMNGGEDSLEELLHKCGDGIYIYEAYDQFHGLNTVTGDFSFPCKGVLIKNGQLTTGVSFP
jgi:predicted Zn-dependent protease